MFDNTRLAENNRRIVGNVFIHNTIVTDFDVISHVDTAKYLCARSNKYVIANNRSFTTAAPKYHLVEDCNVTSNHRPPRNNNPIDTMSRDIRRRGKVFTRAGTFITPPRHNIGSIPSHYTINVQRIINFAETVRLPCYN